MYEDLITALRGVARCGDDPMVQMFNSCRMAEDCADAMQAINERLAAVTAERDRYREDSVVLSLMLLCGGKKNDREREERAFRALSGRKAPEE